MTEKFGWCIANQHDQCIERFKSFYIGQKRVKRKLVESVVYLDGYTECSCSCHQPEPVKTKAKRTRRKS